MLSLGYHVFKMPAKKGGTSAWRAPCSQGRNIAYHFIFLKLRLSLKIFKKKKWILHVGSVINHHI
jgi:hypothetical protein